LRIRLRLAAARANVSIWIADIEITVWADHLEYLPARWNRCFPLCYKTARQSFGILVCWEIVEVGWQRI
jgi:hypothetical protein